MQLTNILIGILILAFGYPIGNFLSRVTKEELKSGQKWFKIITSVSLIGGVVGLVIGNDIMLFSFFFIAIVTSRSLKK